jgi:glycosidase
VRVAAAALLALPGTPFIYYGEEIGMQGGPTPRDEDKRTPMRWTAEAPGHGFTGGQAWHTAAEAAGIDVESQRALRGSTWRLFRDLIAIRSKHVALAKGGASRPKVNGAGRGVAVWLREHDGARVLCAINFAREPAAAFSVEVAGQPKVLMSENAGQAPRSLGTSLELGELGPRGFVFIALE